DRRTAPAFRATRNYPDILPSSRPTDEPCDRNCRTKRAVRRLRNTPTERSRRVLPVGGLLFGRPRPTDAPCDRCCRSTTGVRPEKKKSPTKVRYVRKANRV